MQSTPTRAASFQSTPPRRRRHPAAGVRQSQTRFQSTPPRRRRPRPIWCPARWWRFNPRLRAGGDKSVDPLLLEHDVSIHASAQEATSTDTPLHRSSFVSIHASAQEATFGHATNSPATAFQSTPPRRRRPCGPLPLWLHGVSIHASAQEATSGLSHRCPSRRFNPRLRAGGDATSSEFASRRGAFQSTPPRRRRRRWRSRPTRCRSFNPRLRAGGDGGPAAGPQWSGCFNPRLRAGGDGGRPWLT